MVKDIYDKQAACLNVGAELAARAREVYQELGAATLKQGTHPQWDRIRADLDNASDLLNDLLNNLQTITGGPEGVHNGG
jgi:hypothetical protein